MDQPRGSTSGVRLRPPQARCLPSRTPAESPRFRHSTLFNSILSNLTFPPRSPRARGGRERCLVGPAGPHRLRSVYSAATHSRHGPAPPPQLKGGNWTESSEGPAPRSPGNEDWLENREGAAPYLKPGTSRACALVEPSPASRGRPPQPEKGFPDAKGTPQALRRSSKPLAAGGARRRIRGYRGARVP